MTPKRRRMAADILIIVLTLCVYLPTVNNGFIWDDDYYVTENQTLRDVQGLGRIWFELGAVPQYYPMTHTTFWVEYQLWQLHPLGYHLVNILLHALVAIFWSRLLVRIGLTQAAAMLAAMVFAVHPVHVESVAWITERKNVLSGLFYLSAAICYFKAVDGEKVNPRAFAASLLLFVAALLSKSVTATLPCALLLVTWMRVGRWCKRDLLVLPYFALGIAMGLLTVYMEREHVGASGEEWAIAPIERVLLAGRALWFYASKLAWPHPLIFVYPRWTIDQAVAWQYLYPAAAIAVMAGLWAMRHRIGRGPLTGVLFFAGTLFPALGFFDVFPFRYSFVADHFQYLASMGLIALAAAGIAKLKPRIAVAVVWLAILSGVARPQTEHYRDLETLWRHTIARNPQAWMAYNNLGTVLNERGDSDEAIDMFRRVLVIRPQHFDARYNLGIAHTSLEQYDDAITTFRAVLAQKPDHIRAANALTYALLKFGRLDEAEQAARHVMALKPRNKVDLAEALHNAALIQLEKGDAVAASKLLAQAVDLDPNSGALRQVRGSVLLKQGRHTEAINSLRRAIELSPDLATAHRDLGMALARTGQMREAEAQFAQAANLNRQDASAWSNLGVARLALGDAAGAIEALRQALTVEPDRASTARSLAWILATHPDDAVRHGKEAVRLAEHAAQLTNRRDALILDTLAAAYAEVGRFDEAVATAKDAADLATQAGRDDLSKAIDRRNRGYLANQPFRDGKR